MFNSLKKLFKSQKTDNDEDPNYNLKILCGLMIEAANTDGTIDSKEIDKIKFVLINIFKENPDNVREIIENSLENKNNTKSLYFYTSKINKEYSDEEKILLLETLWEIVLSDGQVHDYESSLLRRLAGLLYISDVNAGNAKKRALNKNLVK